MYAAVLLASLLLPTACSSSRSGSPDAATVDTLPALDPPYLWYAGSGLNAFTLAQTEQSGDDGAQYNVTPNVGMQFFHDLAFDAQGNLWTIPFSGDQVVRVSAAQLPPGPGSEAPPTDLMISSSALQGAQNLAFDDAGNLWVLSYDGAGQSIATISRFDSPSVLQGEVTLQPSVTIGPGASAAERRRFTQASAIAFDGDGNLWLAATANVLRFDRPQGQTGSVAPSPSAIIEGGDAYAALGFDATGALWVSGAGSGYFVERFDRPGALSGSVNPTPDAKVVLPSSDATHFAGGFAFDGEGALWIVTSNRLLKLSAAGALKGTIQGRPAVILGTTAAPDLSSKLVLRGGGPAGSAAP